jgi:hypothetical protein
MIPENTKESLTTFAKYVVSQSRANLTRGNKNVSKELWDSIGYELDVHKNSFSLRMLMEDYGVFQDRGVKGTESGRSLDDYSYKQDSNLVGMEYHTGTFGKWAKFRGKQGRDKLGRFISYKQTGFMLAALIKKKGIKASKFFTKPFEKAFKNLPEEVVEAFGLDVISFIKFTNNGKN